MDSAAIPMMHLRLATPVRLPSDSRPESVPVKSPAFIALASLLAGSIACAGAMRSASIPADGPVGVDVPACVHSTADGDRDALDDGCELALARAFAPVLVADRRDCLWAEDASGARLGGGYLFAAQPIDGGVRIAYMPAYWRDCGWPGAACALRLGRCGAHAGDSEIVLVDVAPSGPARWATTAVFLSAHCFGRSDGRCRWYRGDELRAFAWANAVTRGAPRVWVARGKHGGYPTRVACDGGHWGLDSCGDDAAAYRFPVVSPRQNVGSRRHPMPASDGCQTSAALAFAGAEPNARECPWDESRPFRGWRSPGRSASTSYARYLARVAAF